MAVLSLFTYSCTKEDLGNYKYHDINEPKFTDGLNGTLNAVVAQQLTIRPTVEFTQDAAVTDPNRYSYEWVYSETVNINKLRTLATTKDLDIKLNILAGSYYVWYKITDKVTQVVFSKKFNLEVRNEISEGWLLMTEVNGNARVDMLSRQLDGSFITIKDLLGSTGSDLKLKGAPKVVYSYFTAQPNGYGIPLSYGVYFGTDQSIDRVDPVSFAWKPAYNVKREILNADLPENFSIAAVKRSMGLGNKNKSNCYILSSSGDLYFNGPTALLTPKYGPVLNFDNATKVKYQLAPFIGACENGNGSLTFPAFFYDVTNKRILRHAVGTSAAPNSLAVIPNPPALVGGLPNPNALFSFSVGMDLVYMTGGIIRTPTAPEIYAVFRDPATSKFWLMRFEQTNATKQVYFKEIVATDFDKAENFAVSNLTGYLFYNVGSKLYLYDPFQATPLCTMMKDYGAEKISALKFPVYHSGAPGPGLPTPYPLPETDKLWVCYYNPAGTEGENGKMDKFSINLNGTGLTQEGPTFTGFGKVKTLHYREKTQ